MTYQLDFAAVLAYRGQLLSGVYVTILLTVTTLFSGFLLSIAIAFGRTSAHWLLRFLCAGYVEVIRNTPMLVQLFFVYFGLAWFGLRLSPVMGAYIVITMNVGAYSTEIVRAGLEATPRGSIEAGRSLAMSRLQVFRYVMLKPALQRIYPALTSQFIMVMLGTSVASQIGTDELTAMGSFIDSRSFRSFEVYVVIGAIYLTLAIALRQIFDLIGRTLVYRR